MGIVEIGVLDGETTKEMGLVSKVPIYGIDPIIPDSMNRSLIGSVELITRHMAFYKDFHFFKNYSHDVAKDWKYKFDFIWLDGDHTYEAVKTDFNDWIPMLELNGFFALHDVFPNVEGFKGWPGPRRLYDEIKNLPNLKQTDLCNSMVVFQKIA
jgi:hypothetical protein